MFTVKDLHSTPRKGIVALILENGYSIPPFIERVKHLCVNDPSEYKGLKVYFEVRKEDDQKLIDVFNSYSDERISMLHKQPFTSLLQIFKHCDVKFRVSGQVNQREIGIYDEQKSQIAVRLYFNLKDDGTEEFVCQE